MTEQPVYQQYYGPPAGRPAEPKQKSMSGWAVGLIGGLVGGIIGLGVGALASFVVFAALPSMAMPASLGDDPRIDELYSMCRDGNMAACDLMFYDVAPGSSLEEFAAACGGRVANPNGEYCTDLDPQGDADSLGLDA